jgi:multicomponent Na+:H+ antiporter subunit G
MSLLLDLLSGLFLLAGSVLCVTGGVALLRLPDFFSRVHGGGVTDTLAAPLLLGGLMLQMDWSLDLVKVVMIMVFVLSTNPTASHSMAKAALHGGQQPLVADADGELPEDASSKA